MTETMPDRILVVDDERAIRELVRRLLERAGFACATAGSGAEADELLARESFELLLADLQMPGESGLDLIGRVREGHRDTATIMITGVDDPQLADTALRLGAYGYIVKPFSPTELSIQVLNALRRRALEIEIEQRHERRRLEQTVATRTAELRFEQLERSQDETSRRLASAVAARDHETADATGYPRALAADEIPLEGRIVAVVDVFDALTSDRPYRRALSLSEALELLEQGRGTQFDADVLDAFLDALESESPVARIPTEALL